MGYTGSVDLVSGIRPKNNGTFPLVDAKDVRVDDNTRLDAALANVNTEIGKAVRYDSAQSLTDAQKTTARTNVGAASQSDFEALKAVRYDAAQTLTDAQKQQARENIGAGKVDDTFSVEGMAADAKKTGDRLSLAEKDLDTKNQKVFVGDPITYSEGDIDGIFAYRSNQITLLTNTSFKSKKILVEDWMGQIVFSLNSVEGINDGILFCGFSDIDENYISSNAKVVGPQNLIIPPNAKYIYLGFYVGSKTLFYNTDYRIFGNSELTTYKFAELETKTSKSVAFIEQELTEEEKEQARININANFFTMTETGERIDTTNLPKQPNKYWGNGGLLPISGSIFYALEDLIDVTPGAIVTLNDFGLYSPTNLNSAAFGLYDESGNDAPGRCNFNHSSVISISDIPVSNYSIVSEMKIKIPDGVYKLGLFYVTKISGDEYVFAGTPTFSLSTNIQVIPNPNIEDAIKKIVSVSQNPYSGMAGVAFGTSLTYRALTTGGYLQYLPDLSGITFDNQGVGSSTILEHSGNPNMLDKITNYTSFADKNVAILEGFVNDWYHNPDKLGSWKDEEQTTVCGCVRYALRYILTQNPNLTIFLILDHFGKGITAADVLNSANQTQFEYYQEIEKIALSMGVRVIKEYELSEISQLTPQYLLDNIHLNALGAKQSARAIWSGIKNTYPNMVDS